MHLLYTFLLTKQISHIIMDKTRNEVFENESYKTGRENCHCHVYGYAA